MNTITNHALIGWLKYNLRFLLKLFLDLSYSDHLPSSCCLFFQISDQGVIALSERCPTLRELHVSSCYGVTDKSVIALAKQSGDLTELDVSWCFCVTDQSIKEFLSPRCKLRLLRIKGCAVSTSMVSTLLGSIGSFLFARELKQSNP